MSTQGRGEALGSKQIEGKEIKGNEMIKGKTRLVVGEGVLMEALTHKLEGQF